MSQSDLSSESNMLLQARGNFLNLSQSCTAGAELLSLTPIPTESWPFEGLFKAVTDEAWDCGNGAKCSCSTRCSTSLCSHKACCIAARGAAISGACLLPRAKIHEGRTWRQVETADRDPMSESPNDIHQHARCIIDEDGNSCKSQVFMPVPRNPAPFTP